MTIDDFLQREIDVGSFPGAAYAIGRAGEIEEESALGHAVVVPLRLRATPDTIYDCASLTKPLITTTLILQAVAEARLTLDEPVSQILPEVRHAFTFQHLLTHTSGLSAWLPLYAEGDDYLATIARQALEVPTGTRVIYSDLNFILLYYTINRIYGDYAGVAREKILERLGVTDDAMLHPSPALRPRIAATEWGQRQEMRMCADRGVTFPRFRSLLIWGETNDGNSHHLGGTAGNAGLFATARAVFRIAQACIDGTLVPPSLFELATHNYTSGLGENRGLGWQLSAPDAPATQMLSEGSFGHTGFTGTSLWVDRESRRIMVLLTNRVHPCAASVGMQRIRGEFHRLALRG